MKKSDDVKIYYTLIDELDDGGWHKRAYELLDEGSIKKIKPKQNLHQRSMSIAGRLLILYALNDQGFKTECIPTIEYEEGGKPYIENAKGFYFNISHSGNIVVCATSNASVGVDVEKEKPAKLSLAKRFFEKTEYERISESPDKKRDELFFKYWTCKESFIKATGEGLKRGLGSFTVGMDETTGMIICGKEKYEYFSMKVEETYSLSVCMKKLGQIDIRKMELADILK